MGFGSSFVSCPSCGGTAAQESVYRVGIAGFARTPASERDWSRSFREFQEVTGGESIPVPTFQDARRVASELKRKGVKDANDIDVKRL